MSAASVHTHLVPALQAAVPLWITELQRLHGGPTALDVRKARALVAPLLETQGDALLYQRVARGETAEVFNALAYGLAVLAFQPDGVTVWGLHFEGPGHAPAAPGGAPPMMIEYRFSCPQCGQEVVKRRSSSADPPVYCSDACYRVALAANNHANVWRKYVFDAGMKHGHSPGQTQWPGGTGPPLAHRRALRAGRYPVCHRQKTRHCPGGPAHAAPPVLGARGSRLCAGPLGAGQPAGRDQ